MCTVSWFSDGRGYELFANRDESRERPPALPPRPWETPAGRFLAPEDTAAGGSWVTVNQHGLALCLLNLYEVEPPSIPASGWTSRGLLVTSLALAEGLPEASTRLGGLDLGTFRPFTLAALAPDRQAILFRWDGRRLDEQLAPENPLSSSGFDAAGAAAARRRLLAELAPGGPDHASLLEFHRSHRPERGPYSPCMHRHDAVTVSFTWVRVEADRVVMAYAAGAPCTAPLSRPSMLARLPALAFGSA